jgi:hypothetical protein
MPIRDHLGHFVRRAEAASEPAQGEALEAEPPALSPVEVFRQAQEAWQEHQRQLADLRDEITAAVEARREAVAAEDWTQVAAIDAQIGALRVRLEGDEIRDRSLAQAVTAAQEGIGRAEQEALRRQIERAVEALCAQAHNLIISIDYIRSLQLRLGMENPVMEGRYVSTHLINTWAELHRRKTHREAA